MMEEGIAEKNGVNITHLSNEFSKPFPLTNKSHSICPTCRKKLQTVYHLTVNEINDQI